MSKRKKERKEGRLFRNDLERIRQIIIKDEAQSWGQLREKTGLSTSVLKHRMDFLIDKLGEVEAATGKHAGRRKTLYGLANEEKSKARSAKYEAIRLIENISNPVHGEYEKEGKTVLSAFIYPVKNGLREKAKKKADDLANRAGRALSFSQRGLSKGQKIAIIMYIEK